MNHHLNHFRFGSHPVRVIQGQDGEPWWITADVCAVLTLQGDPGQHTRRLDDDEKGLIQIQTPGGAQKVSAVNESGLYSLILRSDKPEAKAFKKWITSEVIPSIRKTGSYGAVNPASLSRMDILSMALEAEQKAQALACQVSELSPKAAGLDRISTAAEGSMCLTDGAKHLQLQPKALFAWLQAHGWIYRRAGNKNWIAYQERIKSGLLEHKVKTVPLDDGSERVCEQVLITPKGLARLAVEL